MSSAPAQMLIDGTAFLDRMEGRRVAVSSELDPQRRKDLGQFMTPAPVAALMASLVTSTSKPLRVLDPGAGIGSLSLAIVDELCARRTRPSRIHLTAVELDAQLHAELSRSVHDAMLHCAAASIDLKSDIVGNDFIDYGCAALEAQLSFDAVQVPRFDLIILNPPYRKLSSASHDRGRLEQLGIDAPNLYAAFLGLSARLLAPAGQLIAITPRSFCNGRYFLNFRKQFTADLSFKTVHVIESRAEAFGGDGVLQENIIFHAVRTERHLDSVMVTSGPATAEGMRSGREIPYDKLISPTDPDLFIHLPHDSEADEAAEFIQSLPCGLADLGVSVSTGRVVDFRSRMYLSRDPGQETVPLIYPTHLQNGRVIWPKAGKKPNALIVAAATTGLLVPPGNYVLVKRFSAKEETRRVVAGVCRTDDLPESAGLAFENHLNYFHADHEPLDYDFAVGLAAFLNSRLVDDYFRQFSGHTQVNAGDLRKLRYPSASVLKELGRGMKGSAEMHSESEIDEYLHALIEQA